MGQHEILNADLVRKHAQVEEMGGKAKLETRRNAGLLNARERLDYLLDEGSFREVGKFATSLTPQDRDTTPADGKVTGFGRIRGRRVAAISNDLTIKGASSSPVNAKKMSYIKKQATRTGTPIVFLGESSGSRMPDSMGAISMGMAGQDPEQYQRKRTTPWAAAVLGPCFGSSAWYTVLSDFVVMRKGAELAVSSAKVTSMAINQAVSSEELGGWRLHTEVTGMVDCAVNSDEEALTAIQNYLSYLPSHHNELPPIAEVPKGSGEAMANILSIIPEQRQKTYDIRKIIDAIADLGSVFPMKEKFGRSAVTALARVNGHSVGFVATNPRVKGGAMDVQACEKVTSFLIMCDSFNIPLVFLVDTPGFLVGVEGERQKAPGKIMNFMSAMQFCSVPKISIILRKDYGQAYLNMGGGRNAHEVAAWTTAEISFIAPELGVHVVHGLRPEDDPKRYAELLHEMSHDTSPYELARCFGTQDVIDPRETRQYLIGALDTHRSALNGGIGRHELHNWPTTI